jgi:hypothetical protein
MRTLDFRPARLLPAELILGSGYRNDLIDGLVAIGTGVSQMPADETLEVVEQPAQQAVAHMIQVARRHMQVIDAQHASMSDGAMSSMVRRSQDAAAAAVPTTVAEVGPIGPMGVETMRSDARARVLREAQLASAQAAVAKLRPKLDQTASDCVEALQALQVAVRKGNTVWKTPASLKADIQLTDLQKQRNCQDDIEACGADAMAFALSQLVENIDAQRGDVLRNLVPAAKAVATRWLRSPPQKLPTGRKTAQFDPDYMVAPNDDPHTMARKVLSCIAAYEADQRPASLQIAEDALRRLRVPFAALLGLDQAPDMAKLYHVDSAVDPAHRGPAWAVAPGWELRYTLPRQVLGGWSKIIAKTQGGLPIREPNPNATYEEPQPGVSAEVANLTDGRKLAGVRAMLRAQSGRR